MFAMNFAILSLNVANYVINRKAGGGGESLNYSSLYSFETFIATSRLK